VLLADGTVHSEGQLELTLRARSDASTRLKQAGKTVLFVAPPPENGVDLGRCAIKSRMFGRDPNECDFTLDELSDRRRLAATLTKRLDAGDTVLHLQDHLCADGRCRTNSGHIWIYSDAGHLTVDGARYIARLIPADVWEAHGLRPVAPDRAPD